MSRGTIGSLACYRVALFFGVAGVEYAYARSVFSPSPIARLRKKGILAEVVSTQTRVWERGSGGEGPKSPYASILRPPTSRQPGSTANRVSRNL